MTTPSDLNIGDLEDLQGLLRTAPGIRCVEIDPAKVRAPGVWIRVIGLTPELLAGLTIRLEVVCVTKRNGYLREAKDLAAMYNALHPLLGLVGGPTADPYFTALIMPGHPAGLPALHIPLNLLTTQE